MKLPVNPLSVSSTPVDGYQEAHSDDPTGSIGDQTDQSSLNTVPSPGGSSILDGAAPAPAQVIPVHPTYLPKKVKFESGVVPITKIPSSLMGQRNFLLRWLEFSLLETFAALSFGAVKRGIAKTSLALNLLLIIISAHGLYANLTFQVLHIAIHAFTLVSVCLLFSAYILVIAFATDESWWLLFIIFGFVSFDFYSGYIALLWVKALNQFDKTITSQPDLTQPWEEPMGYVSHTWWTEGLPGGGNMEISLGPRGSSSVNTNRNVSERSFQQQAAIARKQEIQALDLSDAPKHFLCPISMEVMADPVVAQDGHSYEKDNIIKWLVYKKVSPVTRQKMKIDIITNQALKSQIMTYLEDKRELLTRTQRSASTASISAIDVRTNSHGEDDLTHTI